MSGTWKKTLKRFIHDFQGFAKVEVVANIVNKATVEMKNILTLNVGEDDSEGGAPGGH